MLGLERMRGGNGQEVSKVLIYNDYRFKMLILNSLPCFSAEVAEPPTPGAFRDHR